MFDIELLRGYYTGSEIKVALIDTGIKKDEVTNKYNIDSYFYDYNDNCVKKSIGSDVNNIHGSTCGKYILSIAPEITLIDINVENSSSEIYEKAVCEAIKFAVENQCDIINISLGFPEYSENLYLICKEAYNKGVIINAAASHNNTLVFPADYDNYTIKINDDDKLCDNSEAEKITKLYSKVYQVKTKPFFERIYDDKSNKINSMISGGSSISCAYFTAILALFLESRPFIDKKELLKNLFDIEYSDKLSNTDDVQNKIEIKENSIAAVISSYYDCSKYKDIINKNIVGYYDLVTNRPIFFNNKNAIIDNVYIVNPLNYERREIKNIEYPKSYIGAFKDIDCYTGKIIEKNDKINNIETPIILIVGVGTDCGKFNVQLELKKQMQLKNLDNYCITYNPLGCIFDMDFLKYPKDMPFHDLVYSINEYIKKIERDTEYESIIIDVAGGMFPLSKVNTNDFGMLYNAYLNALPIDYIVICTNSGIDVSVIKNEIKKLNLRGNTDISIVVSNLSYDEFSVEHSDKTISHMEEHSVIKIGIDEYKKNLIGVPIYSEDDVVDGLLLSDIMEKMASI